MHHTRHIKVVKWCQTWHHFFQDPTQKLWQKIHSLTHKKKWMAYLIHFETYSPLPGSGKYNFRKKTCLFLPSNNFLKHIFVKILYILYFHFLKIKYNNYIHKLTNWAGYDENFDFNNLLSCCEIKTRLVFTIKHFF